MARAVSSSYITFQNENSLLRAPNNVETKRCCKQNEASCFVTIRKSFSLLDKKKSQIAFQKPQFIIFLDHSK